MWDVEKAVQYLNEHAESSSIGYCARYVKRAISAGGDITAWPSIVSAKDYGSALLERGFQVVPAGGGSIAGDVVIIQGIKKSDFPAGEINRDHLHGHMAMYNGSQWVSDFKQNNGFYPGGDYRRAKPACVFYRHKDVNTAASGETAPVTHSALKTCFPARKQNGENYATLDEMMGLIGQEPHGSWLAGTNRMWHGGIHITEKSAPGSVLTTATMESAVPLQCMAGGEVVAWRLNQDYQKKDWSGQPLQYTTTFVLVKSVCQPDPNNAQTRLEFYSLYMGLAPLSAFQKRKCMKVKATSVMKHPYERYEGSQPGTIPATRSGVLTTNSRVLLLKEGLFNYKGQANQPFGLAQVLDKDSNATGEPFWVTTSSAYMDEDGEQYARLPVWMQHAVAKGTFDAVVKPEAPLTINAGDTIGFLGEDIVPYGTGRTSRSAYAHIEVLSADAGMSAFLDNPGQVKTGRKYIRVHPDAMLYTNTGNTFTRTSTAVSKDMHIILPVDKCNPKQSDSKTYYQVGQQYWLHQDDVDVIEQYFLKELGFTALEEETTPDMAASLREGWMKSACQWLSKQVMPERGIQEQQMSRFYKGVADKMDADHDGQLSGQELYVALQHPEMGVRDIVSRMVVRHESEWYGGSGHQKWAAFFQDYDRLRIDYAKKWLDDMEWMSQVEPFTSGKAVWHMHPVMFLDAVKSSTHWFDIEKFISIYKSQHPVKFGFYDRGVKITIPNLNSSSEDSLRKLLVEMRRQYYNYFNDFNVRYIAYMLSTIRIESYQYRVRHFFQPTSENISYSQAEIDYGSGPTASNKIRAIKNHNTAAGDGYKYRGRGLVQLTWKINYEKFESLIGEDLVGSPDNASTLAKAIKIMMIGMRDGGFRSGHTLERYLGGSNNDYYNARLIINGYVHGRPDKANEFEDFAKLFEGVINESM